MKKYILLFFLILNMGLLAQWVEVERETQEGMTSVKISENTLQSTGLIILSSNFDGNLALIYLGTVAVEQLADVKIYGDYSYGYDEVAKKYIGISVINNSIVYIENQSKDNLIQTIDSFEDSKFLDNLK